MKLNLANILGRRIKILRKIRGLTQAQLAELLEIEDLSLSRIETGKRFPRQENIEKLLKVLECDLEDLFCSGEEKTEAQLRKEITQKLKSAKLADLNYFNKMLKAYFESKI